MAIQVPALPMSGPTLKATLDGLHSGQVLNFPSVAAMAANAHLVEGDYCDTPGGSFCVTSSGTPMINGTTVIELPASSARAILAKSERVPDVTTLKTDTRDYSVFAEEDLIETCEGFRYLVLPSDATAPDFVTAGGLKLQVCRSAEGMWNICAFGAIGDGTTTAQQGYIQKAIDAAQEDGGGTVLIPAGTFLMDAVPYRRDDNTIYGSTSITLHSNVRLYGTGTLKVQDNAYGPGALYRIISSSSSGVSNAGVEGISLDGNFANQVSSNQCNNVLLVANENVWIRCVTSLNANGCSLQVLGTNEKLAKGVVISDNIIAEATNIGIQVTHFKGLVINSNAVRNCINNGIDVYGNDGTITPTSHNFSISGNTIDGALVGIFTETVRDGSVTGNAIRTCTLGMVYNRINGEPRNIVYSGNSVVDCVRGFRATGDSGGILVTGNSFRSCTTATLSLGANSGNVSYVSMINNIIHTPTATTPILELGAGQIAFCIFSDNVVMTSNYDLSGYLLDAGGIQVSNCVEEPYGVSAKNRPIEKTRRIKNVASGSTTSFPVNSNTGGRLIMYGSAGGSWGSVWEGLFVASHSQVTVKEIDKHFVTTGNFFFSVTGSSSSLEIIVTAAASGAIGSYFYRIEYF